MRKNFTILSFFCLSILSANAQKTVSENETLVTTQVVETDTIVTFTPRNGSASGEGKSTIASPISGDLSDGTATLIGSSASGAVTLPGSSSNASTKLFDESVNGATKTTEPHLPVLTETGLVPPLSHYGYGYGMPWLGWGSWGMWRLHEGLNVSLGLSVFSTFGSGDTWSGAGFAQNLSMMYATSLTNKMSLAVGGYMKNASWAHDSYRDAGLSAVLGYQFDEHWEAYLYAQKSIVQNKLMPLPLRDITNMGDRIGVGVEYHFSPAFSIGVSFEQNFPQNDWTMPVMRRKN